MHSHRMATRPDLRAMWYLHVPRSGVTPGSPKVKGPFYPLQIYQPLGFHTKNVRQPLISVSDK